jgi:hypothetical protein
MQLRSGAPVRDDMASLQIVGDPFSGYLAATFPAIWLPRFRLFGCHVSGYLAATF